MNIARLTITALIFAALSAFTPAAVITVTANNVAEGANAVVDSTTYIAAANVTAGDLLDLGSAGQGQRADNATAGGVDLIGVAQSTSDAGQALLVQTSGTVTFGSGTCEPGELYFASSTAGKIEPMGDLSLGDAIGFVGFGNSTGDGVTLDLYDTGLATTSGT